MSNAGLKFLSQEQIEASIGALNKYANEGAIECVAEIANALHNSGDDNPLIPQILEAGKKFQDQFNTFTECSKGYVADAMAVYDIAEYLKKKDMGTITDRDTSFTNQKIDPSSVNF